MTRPDITLYGILGSDRSGGRPLPQLARQAAKGGVTLLQYRDKTAGEAEQVAMAGAILDALSGTGVPLIVNDDPHVALAAGAAGVHLGVQDMPPDRARRILGADAVIGLTVKTLDDARNMPLEHCDYCCIGGVFATMSKRNPVSIGLAGWRTRADIIRKRSRRIPVGAIAGINHENAAEVMAAGADGVAVMSAIFMADDVVAAARSLKQIVEQG